MKTKRWKLIVHNNMVALEGNIILGELSTSIFSPKEGKVHDDGDCSCYSIQQTWGHPLPQKKTYVLSLLSLSHAVAFLVNKLQAIQANNKTKV